MCIILKPADGEEIATRHWLLIDPITVMYVGTEEMVLSCPSSHRLCRDLGL